MAIDDRGKRKISYVFASVATIVVQLFLIYKASTEPNQSYFQMYTFFIGIMWYVIPYFIIRTVIILLMDRFEILETVDELISKLVDFLLKALKLILTFIGFVITQTFKDLGNVGGSDRVRRNDRDEYNYYNNYNNRNSYDGTSRVDRYQPNRDTKYQPSKPAPKVQPKTRYDPFNDRHINNMIDGNKRRGSGKKPFDPFK